MSDSPRKDADVWLKNEIVKHAHRYYLREENPNTNREENIWAPLPLEMDCFSVQAAGDSLLTRIFATLKNSAPRQVVTVSRSLPPIKFRLFMMILATTYMFLVILPPPSVPENNLAGHHNPKFNYTDEGRLSEEEVDEEETPGAPEVDSSSQKVGQKETDLDEVFRETSPVFKLAKQNFPPSKSPYMWMVLYHSRNSHALAVKDAYEEFAKQAHNNRTLRVGAVDCYRHNQFCADRGSEVEASDSPYMEIVRSDTRSPLLEVRHDSSVEQLQMSFMSFVDKQTVRSIENPTQLEQILKTMATTKNKKAAILLLTTEAEVDIAYYSLAHHFRHDAVFLFSNNEETLFDTDISSGMVFMVWTNLSDARNPVPRKTDLMIDANMTLADAIPWLDETIHGKRCKDSYQSKNVVDVQSFDELKALEKQAEEGLGLVVLQKDEDTCPDLAFHSIAARYNESACLFAEVAPDAVAEVRNYMNFEGIRHQNLSYPEVHASTSFLPEPGTMTTEMHYLGTKVSVDHLESFLGRTVFRIQNIVHEYDFERRFLHCGKQLKGSVLLFSEGHEDILEKYKQVAETLRGKFCFGITPRGSRLDKYFQTKGFPFHEGDNWLVVFRVRENGVDGTQHDVQTSKVKIPNESGPSEMVSWLEFDAREHEGNDSHLA